MLKTSRNSNFVLVLSKKYEKNSLKILLSKIAEIFTAAKKRPDLPRRQLKTHIAFSMIPILVTNLCLLIFP